MSTSFDKSSYWLTTGDQQAAEELINEYSSANPETVSEPYKDPLTILINIEITLTLNTEE